MSDRIDPAYFDLIDAQKYSGLSKSTLYIRLKAGQIEGRKCGKRLLISKSSLDAMLASLPMFGKAA